MQALVWLVTADGKASYRSPLKLNAMLHGRLCTPGSNHPRSALITTWQPILLFHAATGALVCGIDFSNVTIKQATPQATALEHLSDMLLHCDFSS